MKKLVLLRHGESTLNLEKRFTGWTDVELTEKGKQEAIQAGNILKKEGYHFDIAFTSFLKRASETLRYVVKQLEDNSMEIQTSWKLNERHYGVVQGKYKQEVIETYGKEQIWNWKHTPNAKPPALSKDDDSYAGRDPKYAFIKEKDIPLTESLSDLETRVLAYWKMVMQPIIEKEDTILIVSHINVLRILIKYLENISLEEAMRIYIPNAIPLVYELNEKMEPVHNYYLKEIGK